MSEQIKKSDFFAEDPFAEVKATMEQSLTVLTKYDEKLRNTAKSFLDIANSTKTATTDLTKLIEVEKQSNVIANEKKRNQKEISTIEKERENLKKNEEQLQARLNTLNSKEAENVAKLRLQIAEQNKQIKQKLQAQRELTAEEEKNLGTLEKLNVANAKLRAERQKLNLETEKGRERLVEINAEIDKNNKFIKSNSDQLAAQKMNVGNYTDSVKDALNESGLFSKQIAQLNKVQNTLNALLKKNTADTLAQTTATQAGATATGGASKALRVFRAALISTGIGAIVVLFGSLVAALLSTQRGMDAINSAIRPLKALFEGFLGVVQDLGWKLIDAFKNPKQTLLDLANFVKQNLINRFKAFSKILEGIIELDFKKVADGVIQAGTGVENAIDKAAKAGAKIAKTVEETLKIGAEIDRLIKQRERLETTLATRTAVLNKRLKEQETIVANTALSARERVAAQEEAEKIAKQLVEVENEIVDLQIQELVLKQSLNDTSREEERLLDDLKAKKIQNTEKIDEVEKKGIRARKNLLDEINKSEEEAYNLRMKRAKEEEKRALEAEKLLRDARVRNMIDEVNRRIQIEKNAYADRLNELRKQGLLSNELEVELKKEHDRKILELEAERTKKTLEEIDKRTVQNVPEVTTGELDAVKDIEEQRVQIIVNAQNQIVKIYEQAAQRKIKALQDEQKAADDQLNSLKNAAKEGAILDEESIKDAEKRKREAIKEQKRVEKQQQRVQFIQLALQNITNQLKNGKSTGEALGSTFALQSALKTLFAGFEGFYKGTDNAPQGFAWVDEKGAEIHTDKHGNIKDFGSDSGARLKFLDKGDKIIPHEKSMQLLNDTLPTVKEKSSVKIDPTLDLLREQNRLLKNITGSKITAEDIGSLLLVTTEDKKGNLSRINRYKYKR
jgi:hypothetical protein